MIYIYILIFFRKNLYISYIFLKILFYDLIMFSFVILFYLPGKVYFLFIVWFIIISRVVDFLIRHTFYSKIKFRIAVRNYTLQIKKADVNILHIVKIIRSIFFPQ